MKKILSVLFIFTISLSFLSCDREKIVYRNAQSEYDLLQGTWSKIASTDPTDYSFNGWKFNALECYVQEDVTWVSVDSYIILGKNITFAIKSHGAPTPDDYTFKILELNKTALVLQYVYDDNSLGDTYTYKKIQE